MFTCVSADPREWNFHFANIIIEIFKVKTESIPRTQFHRLLSFVASSAAELCHCAAARWASPREQPARGGFTTGTAACGRRVLCVMAGPVDSAMPPPNS